MAKGTSKPVRSGGRPPGRRGGGGTGPNKGGGGGTTSNTGGTTHKSSSVEGTPVITMVYGIAVAVGLVVIGLGTFFAHGYGLV